MKRYIVLLACVLSAMAAAATDISTLENAIYVEPLTAQPGQSTVLSIRMKNQAAVAGFEFSLVLPLGINVVTDSDDYPWVTLSTERTTTKKTNFFQSALQSDGSLRVLCGTTAKDSSTGKLYAFSGNDGEVARVAINIPSDFPNAEYAMQIVNGKLSDPDNVKTTLTTPIETALTIGAAASNNITWSAMITGDVTSASADVVSGAFELTPTVGNPEADSFVFGETNLQVFYQIVPGMSVKVFFVTPSTTIDLSDKFDKTGNQMQLNTSGLNLSQFNCDGTWLFVYSAQGTASDEFTWNFELMGNVNQECQGDFYSIDSGGYVYSDESTISSSRPTYSYKWTSEDDVKGVEIRVKKVDGYDFKLLFNGSDYTTRLDLTQEGPDWLYEATISDVTILVNGCWNLIYYKSNNITFADTEVKNTCVWNWGRGDGDNELSYEEAAAVHSFTMEFNGVPITSFNELQYFTGLTSIYSEAFRNCGSLTSIIIPENVTNIGSNAFTECISLTSITLPNGLQTIGDEAFRNTKLTHFFVPSTVNSIGNGFLASCRQLVSIAVDPLNTTYTSKDNCIMNGTTVVMGCKASRIPDDATAISQYAFCNMDGLTSIEIPASVTSIGDYAFTGCTGMTKVVSKMTTPIAFANISNVFEVSRLCKLYVPYGTKQAYLDAGWDTTVFRGGVFELPSTYDVNTDGSVNIADVTKLVNEVLKQP